MKFVRIVLAVVLTAALLYVASINSRGRPEAYSQTHNDYTLQMTTVPKAYETDTARIVTYFQGPFEPGVHPVLRHAKFGQDATTPLYLYNTTPLELIDSLTGRYQYLMKAGLKGGRFLYYFQIRDNVGGLRAEFLHDDGPFVTKYIGHVPTWIVISHIFLMFATVFFVVIGAIEGARLISGSGSVGSVAKAYFAAAICAFLGGYPFGFPMNWYTFGTIWEGVPFGTDATDNKTQLLFVYLLMVTASSLGSLTKGKFGRDVFSPKVLGWLGALGFVVMLGIYLIPHSIQFSPELTKTVCWSFIGLMAAIYLGGWINTIRASRNQGRSRKRKPPTGKAR